MRLIATDGVFSMDGNVAPLKYTTQTHTRTHRHARRHRHSDGNVITSPALGGGMHCPRASSFKIALNCFYFSIRATWKVISY